MEQQEDPGQIQAEQQRLEFYAAAERIGLNLNQHTDGMVTLRHSFKAFVEVVNVEIVTALPKVIV